ncbi:MAG: site-specific DNA-methyltransferase [Holophagaceae bacterium]|nr:site-specific DNA-methyltransferase [Holophagaceae bacterium]
MDILQHKDNGILKYRNATIINANILDKTLFDTEFIDIIITSPPYNVNMEYGSSNDLLSHEEYLAFSRNWLTNCFVWSKPATRLLLNIPLDKNKSGHQSIGADLTTIAKQVGWKYMTTIIWNEGNISRRTAWGSFMSASAPHVIAPVELIVILYKESWKKVGGSKISTITKEEFMNWTNGLWTFNGESAKKIKHPAPFPRELPKRCIKLFSYEGDVVFDPFMGSGTTLIEAELHGRIGIGVEIDEKYCELAFQRLQKEAGGLF